MPAFFLALILSAAASFGRRDQFLVAHLSARLGQSSALLATAWAAACVTAALAAAAGGMLAMIMPPGAKHMLVALALVVGAVETLWPWRIKRPDEPTRSTFAIFVVLVAQQIGDGARFLILAIAVVAGNSVLAGVGGALGSGAALSVAWALGDDMTQRLPLRGIRYALAAAMAAAGVYIGLSTRGLLA
jgi:putative Ca2+/H+ antiporter (TMEM165/GDT1 family)